jgi:hypothetical protein
VIAGDRKIVVGAVLAAAVSGVPIFIIDNYFKVKSEWGVESHPLLSSAKALHIMITPLLTLAIGYILRQHIFLNIKKGKLRRIGGVALTIFLVALIFSGDLLLVITGDFLRSILSYLHLMLGVMVVGSLIIHARGVSSYRLNYSYVRSLLKYHRHYSLRKRPILMSDISMETIRRRQQRL